MNFNFSNVDLETEQEEVAKPKPTRVLKREMCNSKKERVCISFFYLLINIYDVYMLMTSAM